MEEDIKGKFVTRTKENGIKYKLYVPENVNADTPIFTYAYGTGDPGIEKMVLENGSDSIFIMTIVDWSADLGTVTMNIVNEVKQEFGVTSTNVTPSGFSLGGFAGYETAAENIRQNPECESQTVFLVDAYGPIYYNPQSYLDDTDTINLFKENQTVFFALDHPLKTSDINTLYAKAGLNIVMVKCIGQGHGDINASFFSNGMYDYMAGGTLPKDGYVYSIYNTETGEWEEIAYEEIATKDALNNYFNIDTFKANVDRLYKLPDITIKSDDKTLETYINKIRVEIRKTSFLTANFNEPRYLSTTQVPTAIPDLVNNYFSMTSSLLNSIATKTAKIANIAGDIDYLDKTLASRADAVNEQQPLFAMASMATDIIRSEIVPENEKYADVILTPPTVEETETSIVQQEEVITIIPVEEPKQETSTEAPLQSSTENDSSSQPGQSTVLGTTTEQPEEKEFNIEESFPKYEELYSTDNQTVYNYNDEYKVVIHHDGDKVIGVEHYYDYGSKDAATTAVEQLQEQYKDVENFDKIIQKDQYVKVTFKDDMYKNITLDELKETYKELEEIEETI